MRQRSSQKHTVEDVPGNRRETREKTRNLEQCLRLSVAIGTSSGKLFRKSKHRECGRAHPCPLRRALPGRSTPRRQPGPVSGSGGAVVHVQYWTAPRVSAFMKMKSTLEQPFFATCGKNDAGFCPQSSTVSNIRYMLIVIGLSINCMKIHARDVLYGQGLAQNNSNKLAVGRGSSTLAPPTKPTRIKPPVSR